MLNRIVLVGRTTKDTELRYSPSGVAMGNFTIACDRPVAKGKEKETDFINIITFKGTAEACANYLKKGNLVALEGRLQIRNYENNEGRRVWVSEVIADNVKFLERNKDGSESMNRPDPNANPFNDGKTIDISEDDLPF